LYQTGPERRLHFPTVDTLKAIKQAIEANHEWPTLDLFDKY
jgi:hypothetical protein